MSTGLTAQAAHTDNTLIARNIRKSMNARFPVLSIEFTDPDPVYGLLIETMDIDTVSMRVRTRDVEWLDATIPAKQVACDAGIESILVERFSASAQPEIRGWNDPADETGFPADRAVAAYGIDLSRPPDFEPHAPAVALAAVDDLLSRFHVST